MRVDTTGKISLDHIYTRPDPRAYFSTLRDLDYNIPELAKPHFLRLIAEYRPAMTFAVPHVYVATSARLRATTLGVQRPQLLWDVETLAVDDRAAIH